MKVFFHEASVKFYYIKIIFNYYTILFITHIHTFLTDNISYRIHSRFSLYIRTCRNHQLRSFIKPIYVSLLLSLEIRACFLNMLISVVGKEKIFKKMEVENYVSHVPKSYTDTLWSLDLCECIYLNRHVYVSQTERWLLHICTTLDMLMIYRLYNYIIWLNFVFTLQISGYLIPRAAE